VGGKHLKEEKLRTGGLACKKKRVLGKGNQGKLIPTRPRSNRRRGGRATTKERIPDKKTGGPMEEPLLSAEKKGEAA